MLRRPERKSPKTVPSSNANTAVRLLALINHRMNNEVWIPCQLANQISSQFGEMKNNRALATKV